jgi:5-methylcytosine-specific restriction protein A
MPPAVYRPCGYVGPEGPCFEYAVRGGRCEEHQRKAWSTSTRPREARGYDARWRRVRDAYRAAHPVCEVPGCGAPAAQVDHVLPFTRRGARLDAGNLQSLCEPHHASKTGREGNAASQAAPRG